MNMKFKSMRGRSLRDRLIPFLLTAAFVIVPTTMVDLTAQNEMVRKDGVISESSGDRFTLKSQDGSQLNVRVGTDTQIEERKRNFFRGARVYLPKDLIPGLQVRVRGVKDSSGSLNAHSVRFTQNDLQTARTFNSRLDPVERELDATKRAVEGVAEELDESKRRQMVLEGQVEEVDSAARKAREEAREAQDLAKSALTKIDQTNDRVSSLDDYEVVQVFTVYFDMNSSELTAEGKEQLESLVELTRDGKGYLLEVAGFASSDGDATYNQILSERRADAVVNYLVNDKDVPMRRIITPFGFGETRLVGDDSSVEGRGMNRRVEIKLLINRGLQTSLSVASIP